MAPLLVMQGNEREGLGEAPSRLVRGQERGTLHLLCTYCMPFMQPVIHQYVYLLCAGQPGEGSHSEVE